MTTIWLTILVLTLPGSHTIQGEASSYTYRAFTQPFRTIQVSSPESGRVAEVHVRPGDEVSAGEELLRLDDAVLQRQRETADRQASMSARLSALKIEQQTKQARLEHLQELLADGATSQEEIKQAKADAQVAELNIQAEIEQMQLAESRRAEMDARLMRRKVTGTINGTVVEVLKEPGEFVSASDPHVVTIVQLDRLRCTFFLPTEFVTTCEVGQIVHLLMQREAVINASNRQTIEGVIEYIAPVTQADTGRVRIELIIENQQRRLRSGTPIQWLELKTKKAEQS